MKAFLWIEGVRKKQKKLNQRTNTREKPKLVSGKEPKRVSVKVKVSINRSEQRGSKRAGGNRRRKRVPQANRRREERPTVAVLPHGCLHSGRHSCQHRCWHASQHLWRHCCCMIVSMAVCSMAQEQQPTWLLAPLSPRLSAWLSGRKSLVCSAVHQTIYTLFTDKQKTNYT